MKKTRKDKDSNFDLIIFDCDGVLVDSEVISCRAHAETLTRHGYPITSDQVLERFLGRSMRQATHEVEAELGRSLPDDFQSQTYAEKSNKHLIGRDRVAVTRQGIGMGAA